MERTTVAIILMKRLAKATLGLLQNRSKVQVRHQLFIYILSMSLSAAATSLPFYYVQLFF